MSRNLKKYFSVFVAISLIVIILLSAGCIEFNNGIEEDFIYPDSEPIEIPSNVEERMQNNIPWESTFEAYTTQDSRSDVEDWYTNKMDEEGWTLTFEDDDYNTIFWTADDETKAFGIVLVEEDVAADEFEVNEENTVFILVEKIL